MNFYSVSDVTPISEEWIPDYLRAANALVAEYARKNLARTISHRHYQIK